MFPDFQLDNRQYHYNNARIKHCTHVFTTYTTESQIIRVLAMAKLHCSQLYANVDSKFYSGALSRFINHRVQQMQFSD